MNKDTVFTVCRTSLLQKRCVYHLERADTLRSRDPDTTLSSFCLLLSCNRPAYVYRTSARLLLIVSAEARNPASALHMTA